MAQILLSGGTGLLGRNLLKLSPDIVAPSHQEMDITDADSVCAAVAAHKPNVFIHGAALVGTGVCAADPERCHNVNVRGTENVLNICQAEAARLVFISTNYVFDGEKGNYAERDPVSPISEYAKSKTTAESLITGYSNSLVIRTTFVSSDSWIFDGAFTDQFSSSDMVEIIAPKVLQAALSDLTGILHIGTERKSQFELARLIDPNVRPKTLKEVNLPLARDTSLDCNRWNTYKAMTRT